MSTTFGAIGQGNGTLTITRPAVSSGQLLTAIVYSLFSDATITAPAGWTEVGNTGVGFNDRPSFFVYTKVAGGSEPATYAFAFAVGSNGQRHANGVIAVTTDADTVTPVNVVGTSRFDTSGSTANITITGVTTTAPTLLLAMVGDGASTYTTHTFTPPSGFTEVIEGANTGWGGGAFAIFTKDQPTAGATGNFTATRSANYFGNRSWMVAIALTGGGGGPGPSKLPLKLQLLGA